MEGLRHVSLTEPTAILNVIKTFIKCSQAPFSFRSPLELAQASSDQDSQKEPDGFRVFKREVRSYFCFGTRVGNHLEKLPAPIPISLHRALYMYLFQLTHKKMSYRGPERKLSFICKMAAYQVGDFQAYTGISPRSLRDLSYRELIRRIETLLFFHGYQAPGIFLSISTCT